MLIMNKPGNNFKLRRKLLEMKLQPIQQVNLILVVFRIP